MWKVQKKSCALKIFLDLRLSQSWTLVTILRNVTIPLVAAKYDVQLRRPTPLGAMLTVTSQTTEILEDRVSVKLTLEAEGKVCATGSGLFVAVKEGHPAYHRWS